MIEFSRGNLLAADAEALVNTVNTVGVAGKGIALQFRQAFPGNFKAYAKAARSGGIKPGEVFVVPTGQLGNPKYIINFPTKRHWRARARLDDIRVGLSALGEAIRQFGISSIAVPPLGCGNGGLQWREVKPLIVQALSPLDDVRVMVFEPVGAPDAHAMPVRTKRPRMTAVRAALIIVFDRYLQPGYHLKMLEIQKLAYLLQTAGQPLGLEFVKGRYGPYAEDLNHVLQAMEGHFIRGLGDRSRDATVVVLPDGLAEARQFLSTDAETLARIDAVVSLIDGFETPYGLELLATTHWVAREDPTAARESEEAIRLVHAWNPRKKMRFRESHVGKAWARLRDAGWMQASVA